MSSLSWQTEVLSEKSQKDLLFFKQLWLLIRKKYDFPVIEDEQGVFLVVLSECMDCEKPIETIKYSSLLQAKWMACKLTLEGRCLEGDYCDRCYEKEHQRIMEEIQIDSEIEAQKWGCCSKCGTILQPVYDDPRDDGACERQLFCSHCDHFNFD